MLRWYLVSRRSLATTFTHSATQRAQAPSSTKEGQGDRVYQHVRPRKVDPERSAKELKPAQIRNCTPPDVKSASRSDLTSSAPKRCSQRRRLRRRSGRGSARLPPFGSSRRAWNRRSRDACQPCSGRARGG